MWLILNECLGQIVRQINLFPLFHITEKTEQRRCNFLQQFWPSNHICAIFHDVMENAVTKKAHQWRVTPRMYNLGFSGKQTVNNRNWEKSGYACEIPGPLHKGLNPTHNKKLDCSYRPKVQDAGTQENDRAKGQRISSSDKRTTAKCYLDLYETILQRPLVTPENKKVRSININSRAKASGDQAIDYPKARRTQSYPLPNERTSTPAIVPV